MKKYLYSICSLLFFSLACFSQKIKKFDMEQAEEKNIVLSTFTEKIEYVKLEFSKSSIVDLIFSIDITSDFILVTSNFDHIYQFGRKDGRFIKEISRRGNGPDDFLMAYPNWFDSEKELIYVDVFSRWRGIDIKTNKCKNEIVKPDFKYLSTGDYQGEILNPYPLDSGVYIGYSNNSTGKITEKVLFFNQEGKVLKKYPNTEYYDLPYSSEKRMELGLFFEYGGKLIFQPGMYSDTVFQLTGNKLYPIFVFENKNKSLLEEYETKKLLDESYTYLKSSNRLSVSVIGESQDYLFLKLMKGDLYSFGYVNKKNDKIYYTKYVEGYGKSGFKDDINGLLPFTPMKMLPTGELVGFYTADKLCELEKEGLSIEGRELVNQLNFDDNPVIVIVTLK